MVKICVAVGEKDQKKAVETALREETIADVIEIRLDYLEKSSPEYFLEKLNVPLLFTNRPIWEGGLFEGSEEARIDRLIAASLAGAAFVDLELEAENEDRKRLTEVLHNTDTQLILSRHDFSKTPADSALHDWLERMIAAGADIGKIITTAHSEEDALRVLQLQQLAAKKSFPLIAFCMGAAGKITRFSTCALGGYMTYCAAKGAVGTAPGQVSGNDIQQFFSLLNE